MRSALALTRLALVLLCAGLAAACQPLPRPLSEDARGAPIPIMTLRDTASVAVAPVSGVAPEARDKLANAMAEALQGVDILAITDGASRTSYRLLGTARDLGAAKGVAVDWRLEDPSGRTGGQATGTAPVALEAVNRGDPAALKALAAASAPSVAKLLRDDAPPAPAAERNLRQVVIWPVAGAPGDGKDALRLAMAAALTNVKVRVLPGEGDGNSLSVVGNVSLGQPKSGRQQVSITWALLQPDGQQLGVVTQENAVPQGSLDGRWGDVANAVAQAAAPGILALIEKAEQAKSGS